MSHAPANHDRPGPPPGRYPIEALYLHVPFCKPICPFCAFAVHGDHPDLHQPYLKALSDEMEALAGHYGSRVAPIRSVYVGGGTPSRLSLSELEILFRALQDHFVLAPDAEIALELNPEDVTRTYIEGIRHLGCTRLSLGLQSLDDRTLRVLGRGHSAAQGRKSADILQEYGPPNINIDLMFGTPDVGSAILRNDLHTVMGWAPAHVSLYGLDLESGTLFARNSRISSWIDTHMDERNETYLWAASALVGAGYRHYEVSNFCRPGMEGRQNLIVWGSGNYLGLGPGAHSHVNGYRSANVRHLRTYLARSQAGEDLVDFAEETSTLQQANEALMLALRTGSGLNMKAWSARYGIPWDRRRQDVARRLVTTGQALDLEDRLVLTARGFLVADEIATALAADA